MDPDDVGQSLLDLDDEKSLKSVEQWAREQAAARRAPAQAEDVGPAGAASEQSKQVASLMEIAAASMDESVFVTNTTAANAARDHAATQIIDRIYQGTGVRIPHPFADLGGNMGDTAWAVMGAPRGNRAYIQTTQDQAIKAFDDQIAAMRKDPKAPSWLLSLPTQTLDEVALDFQRDIYAKAQATKERAAGPVESFVGSVAGGLAGGFADPVNVATLPVGFGSKTIFGAVVKETLTNAGLGAGVEFVRDKQAWRDVTGKEYTMDDFIAAVGSSAAFGAVVGGGGKFGQQVGGRVFGDRYAFEVFKHKYEALPPEHPFRLAETNRNIYIDGLKRQREDEAALRARRGFLDKEAQQEAELAQLGDPSAPAVGDTPPPSSRMYQDGGSPAEQAARAEAALRRGGALKDRPEGLTLDDLDAATSGGTTFGMADVLDMMDRVRAFDAPKSLLTFVRSQGGIRATDDFAGDLQRLQAPRLLNRNSQVDIDAMAERAAEAGYLPYDEFGRHDINDLIKALEDDIAAEAAGDAARRVYSTKDADAVGRIPDIQRMLSVLDDLGVDPKMRGAKKRVDAAMAAAQRSAAANYGGSPRTLDDLDSLQADMDAAGVSGFRPWSDDMLGADPVRDPEGLMDPSALARELSEEEMAARVDALSDEEAYGSAMAYLDLEAKSPEEARAALLRAGLAQKRGGGREPVVSPAERDAILVDPETLDVPDGDGPAPRPELRGRQQLDDMGSDVPEAAAPAGDDIAARLAALRDRIADPQVGLDNDAMDLQPARAPEEWRSNEGRRALAERVLRMGPDKALSFVDRMIEMAADGEHRAALQEVRQLIDNTLNAKFSDNAGDAFGRARAALGVRRSLSAREANILEAVVASAEKGVDPLSHLAALAIRAESAREIIAHALKQGRLGPKAAARAAVGASPGGMLDTALGRVPIEADDALVTLAADTLSPQQFEIWKLAALEGKSNKAIADALGIDLRGVSVAASRIRKAGFDLPAVGGKGKPTDPTTLKIIDYKARGLTDPQIAARVYPDEPTAVGENRAAALASQWKEEVADRRAELFGDPEIKFSDNGPGAFQRRMDAIKAAEAKGVDFLAETPLRDELRRLGVEPRYIGMANVWAGVMKAGGEIKDVLDIVQVTPRTLRQRLREVQGKLEVAESAMELPRKDMLASDNAPDGWGSVEGMPEARATRAAVDNLASEIERSFGKAGKDLLESGAVVLHPSVDTVPALVPRSTIAGVHSNGTVHIIANRTSPQQIAGLILHEVGVHAGMREMLGEEVFDGVIKALNRMRAAPALSAIDANVRPNADEVAAAAARERIPRETLDKAPQHVIDEELLAYYVQDAPADAPLFRRITAGMAAWMYRNFPDVMKIMKPSQEALRQMAVRSLKRWARSQRGRAWELGADADHIGFYSAVGRSIAQMDNVATTPAAIMDRLRAAPGVSDTELRALGIEDALKRGKVRTTGDAWRVFQERRLYVERQVSILPAERGGVPAGAKDVRDVVYRLPSDVPGGRFSRSGSSDLGKVAVARVSTRTSADGRTILQLENLDSDVHPQNGYEYLRPEIIDPDVQLRQQSLWASVDTLRAPLDQLEREGITVAGSLPEFRAWQAKRQELLQDIANNGDHAGYTADQFGVRLPPEETPLRGWAKTTLNNLLATASSTDAQGFAIPVSRMLKDATPGQVSFIDKELRGAFDQAADDLGLEISTTKVQMGRLGEVDVPVIWLSPVDKARLAQSGVPMYADNARPAGAGGAEGGGRDPGIHLRVRAPGGGNVYINMARIAADADIKSTIQQVADRFKTEIDSARTMERQPDEHLMASVAAVDAWDVLKARRVGEPLGAKESLAARQLWAASAEWLTRIADRYRQSNSHLDRFAFNQALAVHRAIQAEVIGARTETARALRSWQIPIGSTKDKMEQIQGILIMQGVENVDELAGRLALLGPDQIRNLDEVVEKSIRAKVSDVLGEIWRASLLSNPKTHIVNMLSNTSVIALDIAETAIAGAAGRLLRHPQAGEMLAEAAAKYHGVMAAFRAQLKFMHEQGRFSTTGGIDAITQRDLFGGQLDAKRANAVSSETFGLSSETLAGTTADAVGAVLNTPQALLGGADDFFKGINFQGEIHAQAHRIASAEVRAGTLQKPQMSARIAELVETPTETMLVAARKASQERTFTTPPKYGGVVSAVFKMREWMNAAGLPIGHFILPFINTPANIMKWTFSRTPAGLLMRDMQAKLRAGGKDAQMAKTQIAMGTMGLMLGYALAANGQITGGGPVDAGERQALQRAGWQPYSIKVGDSWIAYARFDPLATYLSLAADFHEISANIAEGDATVEQWGEVAALSIGAIGKAFLSKTYLQGVSDFNAYLADPGRYGERYLSNIASSMFGPAGMAEIRRQVDPSMRDVSDIMDAVRNRWPGASDSLAVARDLWGRPRMYQSHLGMAYDALSPFAARQIDPEPVDAEMIRLGYFPALPGRSLTVPVGGRSVTVSLRNRPDIYNRMVQLSGERALAMANAMVQSSAYKGLQDGREPEPGSKAFALETVILRNREIGRAMVVREFWGELQEMGRKELMQQLEGAAAQ